jgi:uncharacterized protein YvpB
MDLASQIKKDPTMYSLIHGQIRFGNPNFGYVGNMYTYSKPGFGVFDKPIAQLAKTYLPNRIDNFTGSSFDRILDYVSIGHPVWVVTTSTFDYVPNKYWMTWHTPTGNIRITNKEHSVLITGYDNKYVYFNDPLDGKKNKAKLLTNFIRGWKQFHNQAISYF